jgi:transposase-like protein
MARRPKKVMEKLRERVLSLIRVNPTLSMAAVARHFGVSEPTVSKWFDQAGLKRWSS